MVLLKKWKIVLWITNKDEHMQRASLASLINGGNWWYLEEGNVNRRRSWRWRFWHSAWLMQMPLGAASGSLKDPDVPWLSTCWILDMFFCRDFFVKTNGLEFVWKDSPLWYSGSQQWWRSMDQNRQGSLPHQLQAIYLSIYINMQDSDMIYYI